jgi:type I restriction enzyme R subunit
VIGTSAAEWQRKLVESPKLQQQALNNSEAQMRISTDVTAELVRAIVGALDSHTAISSQAFGTPAWRQRILDVLFNQKELYAALGARAAP